MTILLHILMLIIGFVFLIKGADFFVLSSSSIAKRLKISPFVIGLTLVALGTSLPELAVSLSATIGLKAGESADIAMGNIVGSNISNITLILGFSIITLPLIIKDNMRKKEFPFFLIMTVIFATVGFLFAGTNQISLIESIVLLLVFSFYMYLMITNKDAHEEEDIKLIDLKLAIILVIVGLLGVTLGGVMVTNAAKNLSVDILVNLFNVELSKATTLIGLSVVALGTSLPELVTSIVAARKNEGEIALGNVVGSNIFNSLFITGVAGLFNPLILNNDVKIDMIILVGITLFVSFFAIFKGKLSRVVGYILVSTYFIYIVYIILRAFNIL